MIGLRKLVGVALMGGLFTGLPGCGKAKGDLGAEHIGCTPVTQSTVTQNATVQSPANSSDASVETASDDASNNAEPIELTPTDVSSENVKLDRPADHGGDNLTPARAVDPLVAVVKGDPKPGDEPVPVTDPAPVPVPAPAADPVPAPVVEKPTPAPVVAPAPTTPAAVPAATAQAEETIDQRAQRLLAEAVRQNDVKTQDVLIEAEAAYQAGLKLFNDIEYEEALKYFERALQLDPAHVAAAQKRSTTKALLGAHVEKMRDILKGLENDYRVKIQENAIVMANALEEGQALEQRGSSVEPGTNEDEKEQLLSQQLDLLTRAQDRYRRVKEVINYMPPTLDFPEARQQTSASLERIRAKIAEKNEEINYLRKTIALKEVSQQRAAQSDLAKARIGKMLDQVQELYDRKQYQEAERLAILVLKIDPMNSAAESLKRKARATAHTTFNASTKDLLKSETRRSWDNVEEAQISYAALLTYPSNWNEICKRTAGTTSGVAKEEAWKSTIRKKLDKKVSFDFSDTPFDEAMNFLRTLAGVTLVVDPKVGALPPVSLRVSDMPLELALGWILKSADLHYSLKDNALYVSKEVNAGEPPIMQIYDVSDLIQTIVDFPGPEMSLAAEDNKGGGAAGGLLAGGGGPAAPTLTNIADMIKRQVRPDSWDQAKGSTIDEKAGKLVVMQSPEVHALIQQLLSNFRSTQKLMVNIESRFLQIREANLEDIGIEMQGLDPNVLFGDFGDIRHVASVVQRRIPGNTDSTPPNAPFPGFTNVLGGSVTEIGSIVNHTVGFLSNETDTISKKDTTGAIRNGGLAGQFTVINHQQLQAFVKAVTARESESTLTAPKLTVFNTQRANMFVTRQQSYVGDYDISGDSYDPVVKQFLVGVVLDIKPIVSSDRRYVTLELRPTVTELVNFATRQIDATIVLAGSVPVVLTLSFPIQFPELAIRKVRTTATVPDGGIMLTGGLYRNVKFKAENGVPFISDLPVIGRLFRWNTTENAKTNLAILVSPRIILFSEEESGL